MIRILHTADWHLGQQLNGWPRLTEHVAFFDWLANVVCTQEIDTLIVAGDIFDTQNPAPEVRSLFFHTIDRLRDLRPHLTTVIIAGNHDHAGHLEAPHGLFRRAGAHVVGTIAKCSRGYDLERHLVPLRDGGGTVAAQLLAIPFPHPGALPVVTPGEAGSEPRGIFAVRRLYADFVAAARAEMSDIPLVLTGHLAVSLAGRLGTTPSTGEGERPILIGGAETVPHDVFPDDVAYVALGHIHRAQAVGRETIRYAGSAFPLSCGERDYRHAVTLIALDHNGTVEIEHIPIPRPVPMLRIPASGYLRPEEVEFALAGLDLDPNAPVEQHPFVQVAVAVDGPAAGLRLEIERIAEQFPVRVAAAPEIKRPSVALAPTDWIPDRLQDLDPRKLFAEAFVREHGVPPGQAHCDAFARLLEELG